MQVMDRLEALILAATSDGREPAEILADVHMVFVGPPGTGIGKICSISRKEPCRSA
jgi:hypothetical protein